jgi:hypothetical protein
VSPGADEEDGLHVARDGIPVLRTRLGRPARSDPSGG